MYWLDTLFLALLVLGAGLGFISGFLWQIARIVSLGLSAFATIACNEQATEFCQESLLREADPNVAKAVAYIAVFVGVYLVLFLTTRFLYELIRATDLELVDRVLGAVFGAGKIALILGICSLGAATYPHPTTKTMMAKSVLAPAFADGMEHVLVMIPDEYKETLRSTLGTFRDFLNRPSSEQPANSI